MLRFHNLYIGEKFGCFAINHLYSEFLEKINLTQAINESGKIIDIMYDWKVIRIK